MAAVGAMVIAALVVVAMVVFRQRGVVHERVVLAAIRPPIGATLASEPLPAAASSAVTTAPRPLGTDEIELCGRGIVKRADYERGDFQPDVGPKRKQWIANMRSSPDEAVRAAGHYVAALTTVMDAMPKEPAVERESCTSSNPCHPPTDDFRAALFASADAMREVDALVEQATTTSDPFVYAVAVQLCGTTSRTNPSGRCQLITLERWTQIDGDNVVPWLQRAGVAQAQGDVAGLNEALYRASIASANRIDGLSLLARAAPSLPSDANPLDRLDLQIGLFGLGFVWAIPSFATIPRYCTADAVRDANVRHLCDGLASALADKSSTILERRIAIRVAERVGWPAERVEALRKWTEAYFQVQSVQPPDATDCAALAKVNTDLLMRSQLGEVAYGEQLIERSHRSVDALAKQFAEAQSAQRAKAKADEAAASAALAASAADAGRPR